MKDQLKEIYKLAGFKTKVAQRLMKTAHRCIEAAYAWENDRVRKECVKAKLKPAASDKTVDLIENLVDVEIHKKLFSSTIDRLVERASLVAEEEIGEPKWKAYKKIVDKFN